MRNFGIVVNRPSNSARELANVLGTKRIQVERVPVVSGRYRKLINWGCSNNMSAPADKILNKPENINFAKDKAQAFLMWHFAGVKCPPCTIDRNLTETWSRPFLARTRRGSGGEGIQVVRAGDAVPDAELYVAYVPKTREYRLHVVGGRVIFVQQKRKRSGVEQSRDEKLIRNHANGWVFCENNVDSFSDVRPDYNVESLAVSAVRALGLDFGAVDLIIEKDTNIPYVLEVNTAPGLESTRLKEAYASAFTQEFLL